MNDVDTLLVPNATLVLSRPYGLISAFYRDSRSKRSQVLLINHINEGAIILERIGASQYSAEAFCLHPLLQTDVDLIQNYNNVCREGVDKKVILFAMEYRNVANSFLSDKVYEAEYTRGHYEIVSVDKPKLSPLPDVNNMLIADKVQNRKDFLRYHKDSHQRSRQLDYYFNLWLEALEITEDRYQELVSGL